MIGLGETVDKKLIVTIQLSLSTVDVLRVRNVKADNVRQR